MRKDKAIGKVRGIAHRLDEKAAPKSGDVTFSPDYTVDSTKDDGGKVLTDVEVILIFWGSFWGTIPKPSPSSDDYKQAIEGLLTGAYMSGLGQYRGVGQGTLIFSEINDSTSPANLYTDADVVSMIKDRLDNTSMPPPAAGHNRFYAVIVPVGIQNSLTQFAGQHQSFTYKGVTGYYAWIDNTGSLTGHNCSTKVFSHELVEACTNPDVDTSNNSILVEGTRADGTSVVDDEIGDTCNNEFATADMNGIQCSVQSYWSNADNICILPLGRLTFLVDKDTFGRDEVLDVINTSGGVFEQAFWLVVEGFSKNSFTSLNVSVPVPTGTFANLTDVTISPNPDIDFENAADAAAPQRIRVPFDITFTMASLGDFPATGSQVLELDAFIATNGSKAQGSDTATLFELVAGADPYFTNVDPTQDNVFYLSQDLRVFTATPGQHNTPVSGGPVFGTDSPAGAFDYLQQLLTFLNNNFSDPDGADPFSTILPSQANAFQADSSVAPFTYDISNVFNITRFNNYSFAVARVRLRGSSGPAGEAKSARVFFRLFTTESPDTDFQPGSTYPSNPDSAGQPGTPNVGAGHVTLPFFATGNLNSNTDYNSPGAGNIRDLEIPSGDDKLWAYYGCFLNLYDSSNRIDGKQVQGWLTGNHHCLVAQIAFDDAPIFTGARPEASDKLAQRNLQVTLSDNPGPASTHRVPQTFDIRPSAVVNLTTFVDELMIDWGAIPPGSVASIFWPQVQASQVLALAASLGTSHGLSAADTHTIQCKITGGVSYIPIPMGTGDNFAGLLTVDLPTTVLTGQEFNVVVRRVGRRQFQIIQLKDHAPSASQKEDVSSFRRAVGQPNLNWRYVIGTFQVKIPVSTPEAMLFPEENTLAIMKWRLLQTATSDRWYPVLKRYVGFLSDRVAGLGGNPDAVPASADGVSPTVLNPCDDVVEYTGKVTEVIYDCFGDFEGFVLHDCCNGHAFKSRGRRIGRLVLRACQEGLLLSVFVLPKDKSTIRRLVIRS